MIYYNNIMNYIKKLLVELGCWLLKLAGYKYIIGKTVVLKDTLYLSTECKDLRTHNIEFDLDTSKTLQKPRYNFL